jgi:glycosyltransferase
MAESSPPKVSIITIAYNSESTIRDTLISVAQQDYPNIEHIIIDGASTDKTVDIARQFPHISKIVSEKDNGLYDAMNKGILASSGDIIGILNSDDFYVSPDVISSVVNKMEEENSEALYANLIFVNREKTNRLIRTWKAGVFRQHKFLYGWMPPHPTFFIKRKWYEKFGTFNTQLTFSADYEIMIRFLYKHKLKVSYLPKVIVKMRLGGASNASLSNRLKANKEDRIAWKLNNLKPYFFTVTLKPIRKLAQYLTRFSI